MSKNRVNPKNPLSRRRRTYAEIFLEKLNSLQNGNKLISGKKLQTALKWDEDRFLATKTALKNEKRIITGPGGNIGFANATDNEPLKLFFSYSHKDEQFKESLLAHLKPLERRNMISQWHDGKILAGDKIDEKIFENLNQSDIVLLLVSVDFINSKYCYDIELEKAMERHSSGSAVIIPIILRHCLWQYTPFGNLKAIPKDGKAVNTWTSQDEAFTEVVMSVQEVAAEKLQSK